LDNDSILLQAGYRVAADPINRLLVHGSRHLNSGVFGDIPDIGIIIAAYVVTRMAALLGQPREQANIVAKVLAAITIVVTLFCALDLAIRGSPTPPLR
jgi:hypothetical protein